MNEEAIEGLFRDYIHGARQDQFGRFKVGGDLTIDDLGVELDDQLSPHAEAIADVVPGSAQQRSIGRIESLVDERSDLEGRPLRQATNAADIALEGAGLAADFIPELKAGAAGIAGLVTVMALRGKKSTAGTIESLLKQGGNVSTGTPMATRVDKRLIAERRVNKLFDGVIENDRRVATERRAMAVRNEELPIKGKK